MHFLRPLVLSALLYASVAFAVTIPVGDSAREGDVEITIGIHHEQPAAKGAGVRVSGWLVCSMINSLLSAHIYVILCVDAFSKSDSPMDIAPPCYEYCASDADCWGYCPYCKNNLVSLTLVRVLG